MEFKIGSKDILEKIPLQIELNGRPYILSTDKNSSPVLFSAICPHQNGIVSELKKDKLRCPNHGWEFEPNDGTAMNVPDKCLESFKVKIVENELFVNLPQFQKSMKMKKFQF